MVAKNLRSVTDEWISVDGAQIQAWQVDRALDDSLAVVSEVDRAAP